MIVSDWLASQVEQPIPAGTEAAKAREIVANAGFQTIPELVDKPFQTILGLSRVHRNSCYLTPIKDLVFIFWKRQQDAVRQKLPSL